MRKCVKDLKKGDKFKFEVGDFDKYVTMEFDRFEEDAAGVIAWGTVLATDLIITQVGKYDSVKFRLNETVEVL